MPVNGFTVGRDVSLDIIGPSGPVRFNLITDFTSRPDYVEIKVKGLDGIMRPVRFPDGWMGSFSLERQDSGVDDYFATQEANYYAGLNESSVTITETLTEASGAVTQYRYVNVLMKLDDAGDKKGDSTIKQKISFLAARRLKVA